MDDNQKFTSQFFTWNNIGIEKKADLDIELYNLSNFLCDELSINGTLMNKFHKLYSKDKDYLEKYAILQHYLLFEDCNNKKYTNEYKIGLFDITIDDITPVTGKTNEYLIKGQNLTENCVIVINGKVYDLVYEDAENAILKGHDGDLNETDIITLRVIGEKGGGTFYESAAYKFSK
jgi:hypothetical protein